MADAESMGVRVAAGRILGEEHSNVVREAVALVVRELMDAEVAEQVGADRYERSEVRQAHRNGYLSRQWDTRVGTLELAIPRLRSESFFPSFQESLAACFAASAATLTDSDQTNTEEKTALTLSA